MAPFTLNLRPSVAFARAVLACVLLVGVLRLGAFAASGQTGTLAGRVVDPNGVTPRSANGAFQPTQTQGSITFFSIRSVRLHAR